MARSAAGEPVLLGWGCSGEPRMLCIVDPQSGDARTVNRPLDLGYRSVFSRGRVYLGSRDLSMIVVDLESAPLEQITKQLFKLVEVTKITELDPRDSVERELLLITVDAPAATRGQIIELVDVFEGKILNVGHERLTMSLEGHPEKLDDFEELLRPFGIVEIQRTGRIALPKIDNSSARLRAVKNA